jgi:hypothetical protein
VAQPIDKFAKVLGTHGEALAKALQAGTLKAAVFATGEIKQEVLNTFSGGRELSRSFKPSLMTAEDGLGAGQIGAKATSTLEYAAIQERGGTIRPRSGRFLAVPVKGQKFPEGKWPRHFARGELKLIPRKTGFSLLVKEIGKDIVLARRGGNKLTRRVVKRVELMFTLRPSVTLTGRRYVERTEARITNELADILGDHAEIAVGKVLDGNSK